MHFVWLRACPRSAGGARAELLDLHAPPEALLPPGVAGGDRTRVLLQGQAGQFWSLEVFGSVWVTQIGAETLCWAAGRGEGGAEGELNLILPRSSPI